MQNKIHNIGIHIRYIILRVLTSCKIKNGCPLFVVQNIAHIVEKMHE